MVRRGGQRRERRRRQGRMRRGGQGKVRRGGQGRMRRGGLACTCSMAAVADDHVLVSAASKAQWRSTAQVHVESTCSPRSASSLTSAVRIADRHDVSAVRILSHPIHFHQPFAFRGIRHAATQAVCHRRGKSAPWQLARCPCVHGGSAQAAGARRPCARRVALRAPAVSGRLTVVNAHLGAHHWSWCAADTLRYPVDVSMPGVFTVSRENCLSLSHALSATACAASRR